MTAPINLVHLSDLHVRGDGLPTLWVRPDLEAFLGRIVEDINRLPFGADAVLITGDLTETGADRDYARLAELLAPLRAPVFLIPGNHDDAGHLTAAFGDRLPPLAADGFFQYRGQCGPVRILALDTVVPGLPEGRLCRHRLGWLRDVLAQEPAPWTVVMMHHPPFRTGLDAMDGMGLVEGADGLAAVLAEHVQGLRILCGHVHRPVQTSWRGVLACIGGSPASQLELSLGRPDMAPVTEPYAYFVHHLAPNGESAVHARYVA